MKMKNWSQILSFCLFLLGLTVADEFELVRPSSFACAVSLILPQKRDDAHRQRCSGMYSRKSWGGQVDPYILVKFRKTEVDKDKEPLVSLMIFEWKDEDLVGRRAEGSDEVS
jgi:hypothetical protein